MADTKTKTRHEGGRRPRGKGTGHRSAFPATKGTLRDAPPRPEEILGMGPTRTAPEAFAGLFRTALLLALAEGASLALARSRATLSTWKSAGCLSFEEAERARCETFAALLAERGEPHPMRADLEPVYADDPLPVDEGDEVEAEQRAPRGPRVPRPRSLPGDRIRRGGKR